MDIRSVSPSLCGALLRTPENFCAHARFYWSGQHVPSPPTARFAAIGSQHTGKIPRMTWPTFYAPLIACQVAVGGMLAAGYRGCHRTRPHTTHENRKGPDQVCAGPKHSKKRWRPSNERQSCVDSERPGLARIRKNEQLPAKRIWSHFACFQNIRVSTDMRT